MTREEWYKYVEEVRHQQEVVLGEMEKKGRLTSVEEIDDFITIV